jgi:hypothetical protein
VLETSTVIPRLSIAESYTQLSIVEEKNSVLLLLLLLLLFWSSRLPFSAVLQSLAGVPGD